MTEEMKTIAVRHAGETTISGDDNAVYEIDTTPS